MRLKQHGLAALVSAGLILGVAASAGAVVQYTVTDLGISSGAVCRINQAGQVSGYTKAADGSYQAFVWSAGQTNFLGTLVGNSYGVFLNDQGQVVGRAAAGTGNTDLRAVLWQNGTTQELSTAGGPKLTLAWGINNSGQILAGTGSATYLLDGGTPRSLGFEHGCSLNDAGQVVGMKYTGETYYYTSVYRTVLWDNGTVRDLGTLGGKWSEPWDINDAGLVVGAASTPSNPLTGPDTACYWDAAGIHQIPVGVGSEAYGVNNSGQIVGGYSPPGTNSSAFLSSGGIVTDLNNLIDPASGWVLLGAQDINDRGQIIGQGRIGGQDRYYLLTPVPEPALCILLLPGLLWIRRRITRRSHLLY